MPPVPVTYPSNLPTVLASKRVSKIAPFSMAQPRRGTPYVEPTGTDTPTIFEVEWLLGPDHAVMLRDWVYITLDGGTLEFRMPLRTEDGVRFITANFMPDGLLDRERIGTLWRYRATIVSRNGLGVTPPQPDQYFGQVLLLLAGDNDLGTETYLDSGPAARTVARFGGSQIINSPGNPRFGSGSLVGASEVGNPHLYFFLPADVGPLGTWTLDYWIRRNLADTNQYLGALYHTNLSLSLNRGSVFDGFRLMLAVDGNPQATITSAAPLGEWCHQALTVAQESGNTVARLFHNGQLEATATLSGAGGNLRLNTDPPAGFQIGQINFSGFAGFSANIDMWRLTGGVARWTENFTPPSDIASYFP